VLPDTEGRGMSREVDTAVYDKYDKKADVFVSWLRGWAWWEYRATVSDFGPGRLVLSVAGEDMFKVFTHLYRWVEVVRRRIGADVAVAVCEGDGCIDVSEAVWPIIIVRDEDVERLEKAVRTLKSLVTSEKIGGVYVEDHGNFIRLEAGCCRVDLQVDEAVLVARWLLHELYSLTRLEVFMRVDDEVAAVFNPLYATYMPPIDLRRAKEGVHALSIEWCSGIYLTTDEILRLVYKMLDTAAFRLKVWKRHELVGA
jgi:hypothetical protein